MLEQRPDGSGEVSYADVWGKRRIGVGGKACWRVEEKVRRTMIGESTEQRQRWSQKGGAAKAGIILGDLGDFRTFCSFSEWWYLIHVWKVLSGCWRGCRRQGWVQGGLLEVCRSHACEKWWGCTRVVAVDEIGRGHVLNIFWRWSHQTYLWDVRYKDARSQISLFKKCVWKVDQRTVIYWNWRDKRRRRLSGENHEFGLEHQLWDV